MSHRWRFSDGTIYELGKAPSGPNAEAVEAALAFAEEARPDYGYGPPPQRHEPLDLTNVMHVGAIMREITRPDLWIVERPANERDPRSDERTGEGAPADAVF